MQTIAWTFVLEKLSILTNIFFVSQIIPNDIFIINVQEDMRKNRSIEFGPRFIYLTGM